ncbi:hypothetical protein BCR33DRAFT_774721 [Rhizoclosmatium globosum]|uniref:Uncharacterized protein n=1 Tax=Rhizoclosmatium globosum TaxID=329046 RepID=A0A1Y2AQQ4_9FUNG|nr:hypothetical protein BCR33DRAFT_774721 [Rhizoclosmatium globosum]|eukprot:ORY24650.1 hypothetical protein BCR33DRAFT_774721 [Rhizoclosmatium globosum]
MSDYVHLHKASRGDPGTIREMELLFPDGSVASTTKMAMIERPWQSPAHSNVLPVDPARENIQHLQFRTTLKIKSHGKNKHGDVASNQDRTLNSEPKPWSRLATSKTIMSQFRMSPPEIRGLNLTARQTPFMTVNPFAIDDDVSPVEKIGMDTVEEGTNSEPNTIIKPEVATERKANRETKTKLKNQPPEPKIRVDYRPARQAIIASAKETLPIIVQKPRPVTLCNVDSVLDTSQQHHVLKTIFDKQLTRQMWCQGTVAASMSVNAKEYFTGIQLPKTSFRSRNIPQPPMLFSKPENSVQIVHETREKVLAGKPSSSSCDDSDNDSSSDSVYSLQRPSRLPRIQITNNDRIRPQPPIPSKVGKSLEEIMNQMNSALNNLYFYPNTQKFATTKQDSKPLPAKTRGHRRHRSKKPRCMETQVDSSKLVDKARHEYDFFHLHKDDYVQSLSLPEIVVSDGPAPDCPTNPNILSCLVSYAPTDHTSYAKSKLKVALEKKMDGDFNSKENLVMRGHNVDTKLP